MEQVIGATELRQQLTDVLQAVREQRVTYVVETFGRPQAAVVHLDEYRQFQRYREEHGVEEQPRDAAVGDAEVSKRVLEDAVPAVIEQARGEAGISPELARRRAKGYLTMHVAMALRPGEPVYVWAERPVWRMPIWLHLRGYTRFAALGSLDVDAVTGEVVPLSSIEITAIQNRADAIATHLALHPAGTS